MHWALDVTFHEDASASVLAMPQNMAVLCHRALNMLRQEPSKGRLKMKRFRAARNQYRTVESHYRVPVSSAKVS